MVKFIGGPSINAYKNYRNHVIARPGQFRMPRNYGRIPTRTTIIMNGGNTCRGNYGCGWGYGQSSLMGFMNLMPMIGSFFTNLFGLFAPKQPSINQNQDGNIFADKKPVTTTTKTYTPTSSTATAAVPQAAPTGNNDDDGNNEDINATGELTYTTTTTPGTPDEELTVAVNVPKGKRNNGTTTYHGWQTLHASYKGPNNETIPFSDRAFRNWFRETYLKKDGITADIWKEGEIQNFPKSFTYNGKIYTFDENIFSTPLDTTIGDGTVQTGSMEKRTNPGTQATTTRTYKGSITVPGHTPFKTNGQTSEQAVKDELERQVNADTTLTDDQKRVALAKIATLQATEEQASS